MRKEHSECAVNGKTSQASEAFTMISPKKRAAQGSCTSTRCRLQPERASPNPPTQGEAVCVLLKSDKVVLQDDGENVKGEPAR